MTIRLFPSIVPDGSDTEIPDIDNMTYTQKRSLASFIDDVSGKQPDDELTAQLKDHFNSEEYSESEIKERFDGVIE